MSVCSKLDERPWGLPIKFLAFKIVQDVHVGTSSSFFPPRRPLHASAECARELVLVLNDLGAYFSGMQRM